MDITLFTELISSVGLPIALVIAMGLFIYKIYRKSEQREDALQAQIVESQRVNAEAIHTITLYAERLTTIESDVKEVKHDVSILINKYKIGQLSLLPFYYTLLNPVHYLCRVFIVSGGIYTCNTYRLYMSLLTSSTSINSIKLI